MNGVQTRLKCKPNVKRCKRFVFAAHSPLLHPNTLKTKAIIHFQTDHILTRFVFPPLQKPFHDAVYDGTPKDIVPDVRFTMRGKSVYIIVRHVTKASYTLRSFSSEKDKIRKVTLLENHKKVDWELDDDGLKISNIHRSTKDSFPVYVLKVEYF